MNTQHIGALDRITNFFTESEQGSALTAQAFRDEKAKVLARRRAVAAEAADIEAADLRDAQAHERAMKPLHAALEAAREHVQRATEKLNEERARRWGVSLEASRRVDRLRAELEQTAPTEDIAAFCAEMREEIGRTYKQGDHVKERCIDGEWRVMWDNNASLRARADAILAAISAARALRLEALDAAQLAARLADLRDSLPAVEERPAQYCGGGAV